MIPQLCLSARFEIGAINAGQPYLVLRKERCSKRRRDMVVRWLPWLLSAMARNSGSRGTACSGGPVGRRQRGMDSRRLFIQGSEHWFTLGLLIRPTNRNTSPHERQKWAFAGTPNRRLLADPGMPCRQSAAL